MEDKLEGMYNSSEHATPESEYEGVLLSKLADIHWK